MLHKCLKKGISYAVRRVNESGIYILISGFVIHASVYEINKTYMHMERVRFENMTYFPKKGIIEYCIADPSDHLE